MPVSFLDIVPKLPSETVTIDTETGPAEVTLTGISYEILGGVAERFPAFAAALDQGDITGNRAALVAIIAAALGHPGSERCEQLVAKLAWGEMLRIAGILVRLTFPATVPLAETPAVAAGDGLDRNSPLPLSN